VVVPIGELFRRGWVPGYPCLKTRVGSIPENPDIAKVVPGSDFFDDTMIGTPKRAKKEENRGDREYGCRPHDRIGGEEAAKGIKVGTGNLRDYNQIRGLTVVSL
jgi:hypothetical protein